MEFFEVRQGGCSARGWFPYLDRDRTVAIEDQSDWGLAVLVCPLNRQVDGVPVTDAVRRAAARELLRRLGAENLSDLRPWAAAAVQEARELLGR